MLKSAFGGARSLRAGELHAAAGSPSGYPPSVAADEGVDHAPSPHAQRKPRNVAGPVRASAATTLWWQNPSLQSAAAVLIAAAAGVALAIGISLVALALANAGKTRPPPLLLSTAWSTAATVSFSSSLAYLLVHPRKPQLLRIASMMALAMLFSVVVLVLRHG